MKNVYEVLRQKEQELAISMNGETDGTAELMLAIDVGRIVERVI